MPDPIDPSGLEPADDDTQAGELALGVLAGEERAAALRRVVADPDFAERVDRWRLRLAPLLDGIAGVPAPDGAWQAVERAIGQATQVALSRWRAAAVTATAVAAALAALLLVRPEPAPQPIVRPGVPMLAQVAGEGGAMLVTARYDAATGQLRVRTANLPAGDRVPELWLIVGDAAPRSLGFAAMNGTVDYVPPAAMRRMMNDGVTIAISMEPRSAAPHQAPTGDVLGTARLTTI